ncbi:MAG: hypothetical protein EXR83_01630 [Gammaproteobacteria bacterium]|nr:hypothetical protein [Gammaproteobacteria bacterium]
MANWRRVAAIYLLPAGVFQSVVVGGAYGTGREVVEFLSAFGPWGGLAGTALVTLGFTAVLGASFEFARLFRVYNYRDFLHTLLGPSWVAYEICFLVLLTIVLAVTGAAAGRVLGEAFGMPAQVGTLLMLLMVVLCNFFGRRLVAVTLTAGAVAISLGLVALCTLVWQASGETLWATLATGEIKSGWLSHAAQFTMYNSALVPVLLYSTTAIERRGQALGAAFIAACAGVLPALVLHLSFMANYPQIITEPVPAYWLVVHYGTPVCLYIYVGLLFMTIVQTGVGVLQGLNERLDAWRTQRVGQAFPAWCHALLAASMTGLSLWLSRVGIVDLIAKGYGSLAWCFLAVFTLPLLTLGVWQIVRAPARSA